VVLFIGAVLGRGKTAVGLRCGFLAVVALSLVGNIQLARLGGPNLISELVQFSLLVVGLVESDYLWAGSLYGAILGVGIAALAWTGSWGEPSPGPLLMPLVALILRNNGLRQSFLLLDQGRLLRGRLEVALATVTAYNDELDRRVQERSTQLREATLHLKEASRQLALSQEQQLGLQRLWLQSQRLETLGRFAGGLYHEFGNGLTLIQGAVHLALEDKLDSEEIEILEGMAKAVERGVMVCRRFLLSSGGSPCRPQVLDLNLLVPEYLDVMRPRYGPEILEWVPSAEPAWVETDSLQMEQIVMNLVLNAIDASPPTARVQVQVARDGLQAVLTVRDNGTGITPELQEQIFEPFYSTKGAGRGAGLGLAIVRQLAQRNGGDCQVESHPGLGSTFRVGIPLVAPPLRPWPAEENLDVAPLPPTIASKALALRPRKSSTRAARPVEILLVEDERALRAMLCRYLNQRGHSVQAFNSAEEALLSQTRAEVLVTDVILPGLNGLHLAERLLERQPELRVVFISGYSSQTLDLAIPLERWLFLPKPFELPAFERAILHVLGEALPGVALT
jgi:signal transduction histidine kinase/CheY-like chemotaxis protein